MAEAKMSQVKLPPDLNLKGPNAAVVWRRWKRSFEDFLVTTGNDEAQDKIKLSYLRNLAGEEACRVLEAIPMTAEEEKKYAEVIKKIEEYVKPHENEVFERFVFLKRDQAEGESIEDFIGDLRRLSKTCNFNNEGEQVDTPENKAIRDRIVAGIRDSGLQETLLRLEGLNLAKAEKICRTSEQSKTQAKEMSKDKEKIAEIDAVRKKNFSKFQEKKFPPKNQDPDLFFCKRCRTEHGPKQCPAYGKHCPRCGYMGHFEVACKTIKERWLKKDEKKVDAVSVEDENSDDSDTVLYCHSVNLDKGNQFKKLNPNNLDTEDGWFELLKFEDKMQLAKLVPGAQVNLIPNEIFKKIDRQLKVRSCSNLILEGFNKSRSRPIGIVNLLVGTPEAEGYFDFLIVENTRKILLGNQGCTALNLVKRIKPSVSYVLDVEKTENNENAEFVTKNKEVFSGHGQFHSEIKIVTRENRPIIAWPSQRIAPALHQPLRAELERLVKQGAIAKVEEIDSNMCINRVVVIEKPNKKIRLCLDPMDLNEIIVRKPKLTQRLEDIAAKCIGKKYFSAFDLSEGFHHLKLNEESSWLCCFATPFGIYRYLVMPYGLTCAGDLFDEKVDENFGQIPNVIVCRDDILIMGANEKEHDEAVTKVVQKDKEMNAKFNPDKLQYKQASVKFMGQIISSDGMSVNPKDVEAIMALKPPKTREELYKLRGTINYVRRYLPEMAKLMEPLNELTKLDVEFQWLPIHDNALLQIKKKIMEAPALVPFDPQKKSIMQCDASKNGLGCCLFQDYGEGKLKLIACASRKLNESEVNYSQSEKELLSICFATKKFHEMIYGSQVVVETDHKPLLPIMKKAICKIGSVRLQRLRLKLLKYSLELKYVPGKYLYFADTLSRATMNETEHDVELLDMVHSVSKYLLMSEKRKEQFRSATSKDEGLNLLSTYYYEGWPEWKYVDNKVKQYYNIRNHIYVEAGLVFMDNLIIVPKDLRTYVMTTVHTGHVGFNKSMAKARQMFFWLEMSNDIKDFTSKCRPCEKYQPCNFKEFMKPYEVPKGRAEKMSMDILEYGGKAYLVIVDNFSHWIDVTRLPNKSSNAVIEAIKWTGYPVTLMTDNVPFKSKECMDYYKKNHTDHQHTPLSSK